MTQFFGNFGNGARHWRRGFVQTLPAIRWIFVLFLGLLMSQAASAVGLGKLHVDSVLDQPFAGEIRLLSVSAEDIGGIRINLASRSDFTRAEIERADILSAFVFEPEMAEDGTAKIVVRSTVPVSAPFLHLLIALEWSGGRIIREYTALLDPPEYATTGVTEVVASVTSAEKGVITGSGSGSTAGNQYGPVQRGETLADIAQRLDLPADINVYQRMYGLVQANPNAFIRGNMNLIRAGATLDIPSNEVLSAISGVVANEMYQRQLQDWKDNRAAAAAQKKSGQSPKQSDNKVWVREVASPSLETQVESKEGKPETLAKTESDSNSAGTSSNPEGDASAPKADAVVADEGERYVLRIIQGQSGTEPAESAGDEATSGPAATTLAPAGTADKEDLHDQLTLAEEANLSLKAENRHVTDRLSTMEEQVTKITQLLEQQAADQKRLLKLKSDELAAAQEEVRILKAAQAAEVAKTTSSSVAAQTAVAASSAEDDASAHAVAQAKSSSELPPCPEDQSQRFHNCYGTFLFANGNKYVGEWKDAEKHGQGTYTSASGDKYVGEFKDGTFHGKGTLTWADGRKYVGEFKGAKRHGQGTNISASGDKYVGEYKGDKRHGQGTNTSASGDKYVGEYKDGLAHGQGTYTFADGSKTVGEYKDDHPWDATLYDQDGNATYTYSAGVQKPFGLLEGWAQSTEEIPYVGGVIAGLLRGVAAVPVEGNIDIAGIEIPVTWIYALGGLLILLLIWRVWKRRQDDEYDDEDADWPEPGGSGDSGAASVGANDPLSSSETAATVGGSGETPEASVSPESIGSGFVVQAEAARGVSVTTDEVDPLAEADLYAAYGRVEQALVVLRSAIREAPDRLDYKIKLLEVLAQHGDVAAFETLAEEVQLLVDKRSDEWKTIVGLGRGLNPDNPLFAAAGAAQEDSPSAQPSAAEKASEAAGGLDLDAELEAMFGEDDSNEVPVTAAPLAMPVAETPAEPVSGSDETPMTDEALPEPEEVEKVEATDSMELDFESPSLPKEVESAVEEAVETAPEESSVEEAAPNEIAFELDDVATLVSGDDTAEQGDAVTESSAGEQEAEMEGKLDLARAYVEIGDKEAAHELIEEVLKTGSSAQQEVAAQLRRSLEDG